MLLFYGKNLCSKRTLKQQIFQDGMPTTLLFRCHPTHVLYNESFVSLLSASQLYKRGAMITPAHYVNGIYQRKGKLDDEAIKEGIKEISLKKRWAMQALLLSFVCCSRHFKAVRNLFSTEALSNQHLQRINGLHASNTTCETMKTLMSVTVTCLIVCMLIKNVFCREMECISCLHQ